MLDTFLTGLSPQSAQRVMAIGSPRQYPARSFVFHEADPGNGVYIVESGLLRIDRTTARGRITLIDLAVKGMLIGELPVIDGQPRSATLSSVTPSVVRFIPDDRFRAMLRDDHGINQAVMTRLARRLRALTTQFQQTATMRAPARLAAAIVRLVEIEQLLGHLEHEVPDTFDLHMPITQEELGQWAGLVREGAVGGLQTLKSLRLIETGRMQIRILRYRDLLKMAAEW